MKSTDIEIHQSDAAHASRRQIEAQRRAESARADAQHLRLLELELPLHAHFGHDQVAAVAQHFFFGERTPALFAAVRAGIPSSLPLKILPINSAVTLIARAAGDRRHDADRVACLHARLILLQVANVFVVYVDVHEAAQPAVIGKEMLLQLPEPGRQRR